MDENYDVVIIGGGAAGLSTGLTLARTRRSVLVVDAGEPRNAPADGVHNYLGREGVPPLELQAIGRGEVEGYGGHVVTGSVAAAAPEGDGFRVTLADGRTATARRLVVATGLVDELPDVEGLAARWGRDVIHCPFCHGWEVRERRIAILATGPAAFHQALLLRQWSDDVTLFRNTGPEPSDEQWEQFGARGIAVVDGVVAAVETEADAISALRLASGERIACEAVVVAPRWTARTAGIEGLGLPVEEFEVMGHTVGTRIVAGPNGATDVPGVYVAGNATDLMATVIHSAAAGMTVAAAITADLMMDDTRRAVEARKPVEV
jgi:thioredoxin reductase